ncbi:hypothetical protein [Stappia sp. ES.058]|uniref:hypothetical protein n=1 Tax=Stappia sp. ES.058 TaxID=1881061 RepID=UPI0012FD99D0|nr:hypothetical protein [Stappia sp. ES.058]
MNRVGLVIVVAGFLGGCAYAPSGTLFEALDGGDPYASPGTASSPMPDDGLSANAAVTVADDRAYRGAPAQQSLQSAGSSAEAASVGVLSGAPSVSRGLMSYEEAEQKRLRMQELARSRGTTVSPRATTSLEKLKRLRAEHADRAIRDIEGPADE